MIVIIVGVGAVLGSLVSGKSIEVVSDQDVWIPDLRGIPLGRQGDTVAEFTVSSFHSDIKLDDDNVEDHEGDEIVRPDKNYNVCSDPESNIVLIPKSDSKDQLPLNSAVEQFGRFEAANDKNQVEYKSVVISGKCCWELFTRPLYNGKKLRMCRGKYSARDLGVHANKIASIRPVNHNG